jgi:hypothetical protein
MSGGKGGSTTSSVEIPEYIEKAAQRNLNKAERISQLGYVPYYGPDVAAFTPMQQAAFQNTADVAGAFGMGAPMSQQDIMGGMGAPTQYAGGVSGYSSAPIYQQSLDELARQRPAQKSYMDSFFIDPYSGISSSNAPMPIDYNMYPTYAETQRAAEETARMEALRREQRSDDNYERLLNQMGQQVSGSSLTQAEMAKYAETIAPGSGYDPKTQVLNEAQRRYVESPEGAAARLAQEDIAMGAVGSNQMGFYDNLKMLQNQEPSFQNPSGGMAYYNRFPDADGNPTRLGYDSTGGSYGGSLVTGNLSGNLTGLPEVGLLGFGGGIADSVYPAINFEGAVDSQSKDFAAKAAAGGFDPSAIDYDFNATPVPAVLPDQYDLASAESARFDPSAINYDFNATPVPAVLPDQYDLASAESARFAAAKKAADDAQAKNDIVAREQAVALDQRDRQNQAQKDQDAANRAQLMEKAAATRAGVGSNTYTSVADRKGSQGYTGSSGGSSSGNGAGGGGGTVLCTAYCDMGYLPREIYSLDRRYGVKLYRHDPKLIHGYRMWATPIANFIQKDNLISKAARAVVWPVVEAWAEEMAHIMKPKKYKRNIFGKLIMVIGEPLSYAVNRIFTPRNNKKEA